MSDATVSVFVVGAPACVISLDAWPFAKVVLIAIAAPRAIASTVRSIGRHEAS